MAIRTLAVARDGSELRQPARQEVGALLRDPSVLLWVRIDEGDAGAQALLADEVGLHPLLIEDIFAEAPTPKLERQDDVLYFIVHALRAAAGEGPVQTADVDVILGESFLVTYNRDDVQSVEQAFDAVRAQPALLAQGPAYAAHLIVDRILEPFLPLMGRLGDQVGKLEDAVIKDPKPQLLEDAFDLQHTLQRLRRIGLHQTELLRQLANRSLPQIPVEARPFYSDVYDDCVRVRDLTEGYREAVVAARDAHLSMQSHRLGQAMQVLTVISTIMLPLTFITGLYGMNFDHMPGLHWTYGYEAAWGLMIAVALLFYALLRRQGWT